MPVLFARAAHLVGRFFGFLTAAGPGPGEQHLVRSYLGQPCAEIFFAQRAEDQRHALLVAERVVAALPDDAAAVRAALLHDVGKRYTDLGAVGRSVATVFALMRFPLSRRMATYRQHGELGAQLLEAAGCGDFEIAFARHHPGPAPPGVDATPWEVVLRADG